MMRYATHTTKRLELYALAATVPVVGMATGSANAEIIHYGGAAIEVTRTLRSALTNSSYHTNIYTGMRSMYGADLNTITGSSAGSMQFDNEQRHQFYPDGGPKDLNRYERLARLGNGEGQSNVRFAADDLDFATRLSEGQMISSALNAFDATQGILEATARYLAFGGSYILSYGSWLVGNNTDEVRGYAGFQITNEGEQGFGWIDIGWDGETLTIYDWAYNTDGSILAGSIDMDGDGDGDGSTIPGGSGLAALAMGAAGLRRRRKRSA